MNENLKYNYNMNIKVNGSAWNWNTNQLAGLMRTLKSQSICQEIDKIESTLVTQDLSTVKTLIMNIANKDIDKKS